MKAHRLDGFEFFEEIPSPQAFAGARTATIRAVHSKQRLLAEVAEQLEFPEYFGENWDAFEECLQDLLPNAGAEVVLIHEETPTRLGEDELRTYLQILDSVARRRREQRAPRLRSLFPLHAKGLIAGLLD